MDKVQAEKRQTELCDCQPLQAEKFLETELTSVEKLLENDLTSFGKGFSVFETVSCKDSFQSMCAFAELFGCVNTLAQFRCILSTVSLLICACTVSFCVMVLLLAFAGQKTLQLTCIPRPHHAV